MSLPPLQLLNMLKNRKLQNLIANICQIFIYGKLEYQQALKTNVPSPNLLGKL
jgi:hypothetical protein